MTPTAVTKTRSVIEGRRGTGLSSGNGAYATDDGASPAGMRIDHERHAIGIGRQGAKPPGADKRREVHHRLSCLAR